jgi:hypothetical protein
VVAASGNESRRPAYTIAASLPAAAHGVLPVGAVEHDGDGFRIAQKRLGPGRIHHVMRWLGQMQRAFDLMCTYALERRAFGSALADKQAVQTWIADSAAEIQAVRLMTLDAARKIDRGDDYVDRRAVVTRFMVTLRHAPDCTEVQTCHCDSEQCRKRQPGQEQGAMIHRVRQTSSH